MIILSTCNHGQKIKWCHAASRQQTKDVTMKNEVELFITELRERIDEFKIDPEEAAADMLAARGWRVFTEYAWSIRENELIELYTGTRCNRIKCDRYSNEM